MLVIRTDNRRWWDYEIYLATRFVEILSGIGIWLGRTGAILGGLVLPGLLIMALAHLQLTTDRVLRAGSSRDRLRRNAVRGVQFGR